MRSLLDLLNPFTPHMRVLSFVVYKNDLHKVREWQKGKSRTKTSQTSQKILSLALWEPALIGRVFLNPCQTLVQTHHCLHLLLPPTKVTSWEDSPRVRSSELQDGNCRKPACIFWWGLKGGSIFHTHRIIRSLSSGWVNSIVNVYFSDLKYRGPSWMRVSHQGLIWLREDPSISYLHVPLGQELG